MHISASYDRLRHNSKSVTSIEGSVERDINEQSPATCLVTQLHECPRACRVTCRAPHQRWGKRRTPLTWPVQRSSTSHLLPWPSMQGLYRPAQGSRATHSARLRSTEADPLAPVWAAVAAVLEFIQLSCPRRHPPLCGGAIHRHDARSTSTPSQSWLLSARTTSTKWQAACNAQPHCLCSLATSRNCQER